MKQNMVAWNFGALATSGTSTADFVIAVDGSEQPVSVDLASPPARVLSAISVFDTSCARVYLTKPNVISYVPRALTLLKSLADVQDGLAAELRDRADAIRAKLPSLPEIDSATAAGAALAALTARSKLNDFETLAALTDTQLAELERLETAAAVIRADKSGELEVAARTRASGAHAAAVALRAAAAQVDAAVTSRIADVRAHLDSAIDAERHLAASAFTDQRFPGTGDGPWRELWQAAKRFVEAGGDSFPSGEADGVCPLCQQDLDDAAVARLSRFEEFVRSDLRERVIELEQELELLLRSLPDVPALRATVTSSMRGAPQDVVETGETAIAVVAAQLERSRLLAAGDVEQGSQSDRQLELRVVDAYVNAQAQLADAQTALRDTDQQREVMTKLADLQARRSLQAAMPKIATRIDGLKAIATLDSAVAELGTHKISIQLRKIQEAVITDRLRNAIREELDGLNPVAGQVELVGQASKGETVINLRLRDGCQAKLESVLSTGEQAAVATAFFLAELSVSEGRSAIVLDDPASSLDHDYREYLGEAACRRGEKPALTKPKQEATEPVGISEELVTRAQAAGLPQAS